MKFSVEDWMHEVRDASSTQYRDVWVDTQVGRTHLLVAKTNKKGKPDVFFIHGWRGNGLFWDLNDNIKHYTPHFNVYLLDLIGQPGLSASVPEKFVLQKYGLWLQEILDALKLEKVNIVSVSYGAFITLVFATVAAHRIKKAVLLAPAGLTNYSTGLRVLYRSVLSMLRPNKKYAANMLKNVILNKQWKTFKPFKKYEEYMAYALGEYSSPAVAPFQLKPEFIKKLNVPAQVYSGEFDKIFNAKTVIKSARANLPGIQKAEILPGLDHGLEMCKEAIDPIIKFLSNGE